MDQIKKALAKLSKRDFLIAKYLLSKIETGNLSELKIKKLVGYSDLYRARKGRIRVIYRLLASGATETLSVELRGEDTYRHLG